MAIDNLAKLAYSFVGFSFSEIFSRAVKLYSPMLCRVYISLRGNFNSCGRDETTRQQARQMSRLKSQGQTQRFLACHGIVNNLFRVGRHLMDAKNYRTFRERSFAEWIRVVFKI